MNYQKTMLNWAQEYLSCRRAMGFRLHKEGQMLLKFAAYADELGHNGPLTTELALRWSRLPVDASPLYWARRLETLRGFAKYLSLFDPATQIPAQKLLGPAHRRNPPHLYSEEEIQALLREMKNLPPTDSLRSRTYAALFGLLACTGMRISETLKLDNTDVDLDRGLLTVRLSKFRKSRLVPLHPSATQALQHYMAFRDEHLPFRHSPAFFVGQSGNRLVYSTVRHVFSRVRDRLQWQPDAKGRRPRIHDLRHTFACRRLLTWCEEGIDVHCAITGLSTYLGHAKVSDTYWYLTATPELLAICAERFERFTGSEERDAL